jgi:putative endonuclease
MYYVYVIRSINGGKFYKGLTEDLDRRLVEHLSGKMSATRHMLPVELIHVEICLTIQDARSMELYFKSGYGREIIKELAEV